jgi:di/tricarboxylate transporter
MSSEDISQAMSQHYLSVDSWQRVLSNSTTDDETKTEPVVLWEVIFTSFVLIFMLLALLSDRIGADGVMLTALTLFMASRIITVTEGLSGFSNEGVLTVLVLFVVAEGISITGALDWYMGKLLGRPKTIAGAQLRLMIPIATISAFLNNTPVVVVMIPILQRWGKNIGVSPQQLLIPLSFASILGGTCTLIGTSTNLVVAGLLNERYPNDSELSIGLFDLSQYGVPVAVIGIAYVILAAPCLLPGARSRDGADLLQDAEEVLLGARLTQWSPAAGRTVKRSGLRDTGGIFLVSVHRAATGNVHRAVGQEFVLNVGDLLYFTGLVESFGEFCEEHGLEVITNETMELPQGKDHTGEVEATAEQATSEPKYDTDNFLRPNGIVSGDLPTVHEVPQGKLDVPVEIGITPESLRASDEQERLRLIHRMTDQIRNIPIEGDKIVLGKIPGKATGAKKRVASSGLRSSDPAQIVVTSDVHDTQRLVLVGINARDRPGLLLDISRGLLRLNLQLHHTEARVIDERSISIWRCEFATESELPDLEEIWSVLNALLEAEAGIATVKKRGIRVIRAVVTKHSQLIGKTASEVSFRQTFKAAIVAIQKGGKNVAATVRFDAGDVLILQASNSSPLLKEPPAGFYEKLEAPLSRSSSGIHLVQMVKKRFSSSDLGDLDISSLDEDVRLKVDKTQKAKGYTSGEETNLEGKATDQHEDIIVDDIEEGRSGHLPDGMDTSDFSETKGSVAVSPELQDAAWKDLRVIGAVAKTESAEIGTHQREFLTAMEIKPNSALAKKTAAQSGLTKLPGVFLVSIERPVADPSNHESRSQRHQIFTTMSADPANSDIDESSFREAEPKFITIDPDELLEVGDVLWFSGSASAVGDLRKIPGLRSFDSDQVEKINEKVHDRRLVQAVIARKGPLVGKTVREVKFRTRYGAAVIAVHRDGKRIHDHPGQIKLHAGDVLLLEAGPSFIKSNANNGRSFALLAEVEDSAPPRLGKLVPALVLTVGMLVVFTAGAASLLVCGLVASILMVAIGILSEQEARDAVNWEAYVTIACAFGIGTALVNSGVAGGIADFLVAVGTAIGIGDAGLYGAVYLATFLISNIVTNNAAAALMFPIAMGAAEQTGADLRLMSFNLMLAASASFMSPFGYTTNLLIYGPGGYKFRDFVYVGTPMQIVLWILSVALLSTSTFDWWISWIVSIAAFVFVAAVRLTNGQIGRQLSQKVKNRFSGHED